MLVQNPFPHWERILIYLLKKWTCKILEKFIDCCDAFLECFQAHSKYVKAKQSLDIAESHYKSTVISVEDARRLWEIETEKSMNLFQELEEERLAVSRDSLWRLANITSITSVADDDSAEEVRSYLESCNLNDTMAKFIEDHGTGSKRPEPIEFQAQPTSSSVGMGRAAFDTEVSLGTKKPMDTQSLIVTPTSSTPITYNRTETPSIYMNTSSQYTASMASLPGEYPATLPARFMMPDTPRLEHHIRPKKPPRLLQYAHQTYNRPASAMLISNNNPRFMENRNIPAPPLATPTFNGVKSKLRLSKASSAF